MSESLKNMLDGVSISGTLAAVMGFLPEVTVVLTFVWTVIRICETRTVRDLIAKWRKR